MTTGDKFNWSMEGGTLCAALRHDCGRKFFRSLEGATLTSNQQTCHWATSQLNSLRILGAACGHDDRRQVQLERGSWHAAAQPTDATFDDAFFPSSEGVTLPSCRRT